MKFFKNEKGFTLIDITVAIIVILLFMSLISILFFNLTKSSKGIERESQATYIATNVIEAFKSIDYDNPKLNTESNGSAITTVYTNQVEIVEGQQIIIPDGYSVEVSVERYVPTAYSSTDAENDLVKKVTVTVKYKLAAETKQVVLETSVVRK